jgi:hypothetical protein
VKAGLRSVGAWAVILVLAGGVAGLGVSTWKRHRPPVPEDTLGVQERTRFGVDVLNGNGRSGVASDAAGLLRSSGFRVEEIANAERFDYPRTVVVDRTGNRRRAEEIARALGGVDLILQRQDGGHEIQVVVGHDWPLTGDL